jgi:2-desacetyl-2-hydroxyethyl bacteriochlorophyllide A dehydrogenase
MRAVRITEDHAVGVIEAPLPAVAADEVLVGPVCCGICGTDLHILRHGFVGTRYPVTPGHEFAGHVVAAGRDVGGLTEGDFVAVDPNVVCGTCRWCKVGRPNLCIHLSPIGVGRPGAAAEFVAVPARNAYPVRESIGHGVAALIEPLACALHAVETSRGIESRRVLVLGGGTMGLLIAIACRIFGAGSITVSDPSQAKREIARRIGFGDTREPAELEGELFDVVFEAAGAPAALEQALTLVDKTGTLVQVGVHDAAATAAFSPFRLYERELRLVGSNSCADRFAPAIELMSDIRDQAAVLIGESVSVWDFEGAVGSMDSGRSIKTQLRYS